MIGSYVGGWGADELGWRYTFFLVGIPGIFVALIIALTLREPPRGLSDVKPALSADTQADPKPDAPRVSEVLNFLWAKVSFRHLSFAAGLHAFVSYGASTWNAPFFTRIHNMSSTDLGAALASSPASALSVPLLAVISATSSRTARAINVGTFGCPASQPSSWCHSSWLRTVRRHHGGHCEPVYRRDHGQCLSGAFLCHDSGAWYHCACAQWLPPFCSLFST